MKIKLVFTLLICMSSIVFSQAEDKIKKCIDLYESDPNKATKKLKKLIDKAGDNASYVAWDIYVEMYETTYNKKLEKGMSEFEYALAQNDLNILLRAKEKMEESNETDTDDYFLLMSKLEEIQLAVSNPNFYISYPEYQQLSEVCREASLKSKSVRADANLRAIYITYDPDTMKVDSIDVIAYSNAYEELKAGHLENSKKLLSSLILKYPNSYNINMSYYLYHSYKEQMDSAKMYLKKTIDLYPQQIEPRENLAKILFGEGNIFRAKKQIEELMVLYPGQDMKAYYSEVLFVEDKKMDEKRIIRPVYPNQIGVTYPAVKSHWGDYQAAMFKVATFTDPTGSESVFMGCISMDKQGNIGMGYTKTGGTTFPSLY